MYSVGDVGIRLPVAVYYDLDNTALQHGAELPGVQTINEIGRLSSKGVELVPVTGREFGNCKDALIALGSRFAIVEGGCVTLIRHDDQETGEPGFLSTAAAGLGFGYEAIGDVAAMMVAEKLEQWLDGQEEATEACIRIPGFERKVEALTHSTQTHSRFKGDLNIGDIIFVSQLSSNALARQLADFINRGGLALPYHPLFAAAVTSQQGDPEVQITDGNTNKKQAIEELAQFGIPVFQDITQGMDTLPSSIFIGDGYNDLPGFEAVGFSVAMGDAPSEVKTVADHVIESQQQGGFDRFIRQLAAA